MRSHPMTPSDAFSERGGEELFCRIPIGKSSSYEAIEVYQAIEAKITHPALTFDPPSWEDGEIEFPLWNTVFLNNDSYGHLELRNSCT